jgi:CheY-like chemotaxis protein
MDSTDQHEDNTGPADPISAWTSATLTSLMTQQGVASRNQAALIAQICSISVSQARRKLRGAVWLFGEVLAVCQHFDKALDEVFGQRQQPEPDVAIQFGQPAAAATYPARLLVDEQQLACDIQIGALCPAPLNMQKHAGLIAIHQPHEGWLVGSPKRMAQTPYGGPHYEVSHLALQTQAAERSRACIAILDDDANSAGALTDWFTELGYKARAYTTAEQLLATPLQEHDAFIVDLILGGGQTSQSVVERIRRELPQAPIVLLTGQLRDGTASEATLSTILRTQGVTFFEKPVRPAVLTAAIQSSLDRLSAA